MENLTPEQIQNAVVVVLVIFAAVVAIDKFLDVLKKWRQPERDIFEKLRADKASLDRHDKDIRTLQEGQKVVCEGLAALLDHELHNGNTDQMQQAKNGLTKYLSGLIIK